MSDKKLVEDFYEFMEEFIVSKSSFMIEYNKKEASFFSDAQINQALKG